MNARRLLLASIPGIAFLALAGLPLRGVAAKVSKRDVQYQDQPRDNKRCANCRQYTSNGGGAGICALVEGNVSADGWCLAYSPDNSS